MLEIKEKNLVLLKNSILNLQHIVIILPTLTEETIIRNVSIHA